MNDYSAVEGAAPNIVDFMAPLERQRTARRSVICAATLCVGHTEFRCQVLNVSVGGAKLRLRSGGFEPLYVGATAFLWVRSIGAISAQVMWQDGSFVGIKFLGNPARAPRLVRTFLRNPKGDAERRTLVRTSVQWPGSCHSGGKSLSALVHDVSLGGAKIQFPQLVPSLEQMELELYGIGHFSCRLAWKDNSFAGLAFQDGPEDVAPRIAPLLNRT